jgi:IMP cyclohydrolase
MINKRVQLQAALNLENLRDNSYPGRIIIVGLNQAGTHLVIMYAIMGRSPSSRNRYFEIADDQKTLKVKPADLTKETGDASLLVYDAMLETSNDKLKWKFFGVSNGAQTSDALQGFTSSSFEERWKHEPDDPHYTPRISARVFHSNENFILSLGLEMSVLKKSLFSEDCDHERYKYADLECGLGYCIHTYEGDSGKGVPLASFNRKPFLVPIEGNAEEILETYWEGLSRENRVSLAVKIIDGQGNSEIIFKNQYEPVQQSA